MGRYIRKADTAISAHATIECCYFCIDVRRPAAPGGDLIEKLRKDLGAGAGSASNSIVTSL